jgi:hypothetical protein
MDIKEMLKDLPLEDRIVILRTVYAELSPDIRRRELKYMSRLERGGKVVLAEPVNDPLKVYRFNSVYDMVLWLRNTGHKSATSANVYKVLNKERPSAYGHTYQYED